MSFENESHDVLATQINSAEEYISWVRKWKRVHSNMVTRIQYMKQNIRNVGVSIRGQEDQSNGIIIMGFSQHNLAEERLLARTMYDIRATHKDLLKQGKYPKLVLHMDGSNSRNAVM